MLSRRLPIPQMYPPLSRLFRPDALKLELDKSVEVLWRKFPGPHQERRLKPPKEQMMKELVSFVKKWPIKSSRPLSDEERLFLWYFECTVTERVPCAGMRRVLLALDAFGEGVDEARYYEPLAEALRGRNPCKVYKTPKIATVLHGTPDLAILREPYSISFKVGKREIEKHSPFLEVIDVKAQLGALHRGLDQCAVLRNYAHIVSLAMPVELYLRKCRATGSGFPEEYDFVSYQRELIRRGIKLILFQTHPMKILYRTPPGFPSRIYRPNQIDDVLEDFKGGQFESRRIFPRPQSKFPQANLADCLPK
jgi:hypothetical protein